ncbi:MAG TPA: LysR substrate-binding domain-containing protein [Dongiaceae bacterium]|nr:LysR substrate-binding domain-containing protein [Dongiaceae bacterium]
MPSAFSLRALQAFEAAARTGSFVAAAHELSVSPAAISQLIRTLEDQVGRKLFHRINRRTTLTEAGHEILPRLGTAFEELRNISQELSGSAARARLVVSAPPSMAMGWLSTRLADFIAQQGSLDLFLRAEDDPVPFERDLIDLRLSYGRFHYRDHRIEEIVTDAVYPVCTPDFLARYGPLDSPERLQAAPLIHTDWGPAAATFPSWHSWFDSVGVVADHARQPGFTTPGLAIPGLTANASRIALDLALSGLGVALGQGIYVAADLAKGRLVIPLHAPLQLSQPYFLTTPRRSIERQVVRDFGAWFNAACREAVTRSAAISAAAAS